MVPPEDDSSHLKLGFRDVWADLPFGSCPLSQLAREGVELSNIHEMPNL